MTRRIAAFVTVGGLGFLPQLAVLEWLARLGWEPLFATAVAVEIAVLHNFLWHERWTWRDRASRGRDRWTRLFRYHAATSVTTVGNVMVTMIFVEAGSSVVRANIVAVVLMSVVNFLLGDRWTFRTDETVRAR